MGAVDLVGIVGDDDVRMRQLSGGLDFAMETPDGVLVGEAVLADDLQGDDAAHAQLAGLEDLSHAAFAEAFQDDVLAEHQFPAAAGEELVDLIGRHPIAFEEFLGQGPRIGET